MQAPQCPRCGGIVTNPSASQCQFCGSPLAQLVAPYGAAPIPPQGGYAPLPPQQQGYVPPPQQAYGAPPPAAMGAMPSYGQPQQPYGYGPQPGYPPNPYAGYGQGPQVQGWRGGHNIAPAQQGVFGGGAWNNTWNIINIIRLSIAVLVLGGFMFAGCINALSH